MAWVHLYAKRSQQLGSLAGGQGGTPPHCHIPPQAGPARSAATGWHPDRLGRGPDRPVQALRVRKKGEEDGRGKETRERGCKRRGSWKAVQRVGQEFCWQGLKVQDANDVQRVGSFAERINQLAGKETRKALQNYTICFARNID